MRKGFAVVPVLCFLTALIPASTLSMAQDRTVGVSVGNFFKYTSTFEWNSTDPNATLPMYMEISLLCEWFSLSVLEVSGTNVTCKMVWHLKNGSEIVNAPMIVDVDTGVGNNTQWIVSADLSANDSVYTDWYSNWKINETTAIIYPSGYRYTNYLNITREYDTDEGHQWSSWNFYWDQSTGVLAKELIADISQTGEFQTTTRGVFELVECDLWVVPEFPTLTLMLPMLIIVSVVMIFSKPRARTKQRFVNRTTFYMIRYIRHIGKSTDSAR